MIMLLRAIETMYPGKRPIHLFVENAHYHHAKQVAQTWVTKPGSRIELHFIPTYCPHPHDSPHKYTASLHQAKSERTTAAGRAIG
jgi:hypothetical protein